MLTEKITYTDFNGEKQTQEFYFHLTKADIIELEVEADGNSLTDMVNKIVREKDGKKIVALFKDVIGRSYGVKTVDGRFVRNPALLDHFMSTEAYSDLVVKIYSDADYAATFVDGIVGELTTDSGEKKTASQIARERSEELLQGRQKPAEAPAKVPAPQMFTEAEIAALEKSNEVVVEAPVQRATQTEQPSPEDIQEFLRKNPDFMRSQD